MASVNKDQSGWRIRYVDANGKQRTLRPGRVNKAKAESIGRHIDELASAKASGQSLDRPTSLWLSDIGDKLHAKLVRAGLTESKAALTQVAEPSVTLAEFIDEYVATGITRKGDKASWNTLKNWEQTRDLLLACFDGYRPIDSFTLPDGKAFRKWLERRKIPVTKKSPTGRMKESSIRQRVGNAKAMFEHAVLEELLPQNPIRNQVSSIRADDEGKINIPADIIENVIQAAPNAEWRLLVALWRYCGLRKMEPMELDWNDVLWAEGKLRVR
ncbi:MAG: hypothetical protein ABGZ35_12170, partial [Planctomycetaceae bacterium]